MIIFSTLSNALRGLRNGRGATLLSFVVLSLTMAAGTVTFSVVDAVAIRPLPYDDPRHLVDLSLPGPGPGAHLLANPQVFLLWRERASKALASIAAARRGVAQLEADGALVPVPTSSVTTNMFELLGVHPSVGRLFGPQDSNPGSAPTVILSHDLWVSRFGADSGVIASKVKLGGAIREIIGVLPKNVSYPITSGRPPDFYLPYVLGAADYQDDRCCLFIVGRMRPAFIIEQARAEIEGISPAVVVPLQDQIVGSGKTTMLLVLAAVGFLLLVACANTASVLLARAAARTLEFATRAALGASRGQLAAAMMVEAGTLSIVSATVGVVLSMWGIEIARSHLPPDLTRVSTIAINTRVLTASIIAALVCALMFGAAPAWLASRTNLVGPMKTGGAISGGGHGRPLAAFLITNIALVSVVLVATALVVTTFVRLTTADLGFTRKNVMFLGYEQPLKGVPRADWLAASAAIRTDVLDRARRVPGVIDAAISVGGAPPFSGTSSGFSLDIPDVGPVTLDDRAQYDRVTPEYFGTLGMQLIRGRTFTPADRVGAPAVMLINDVMARWFAGRDPVGQVVVFDEPTTIVGVLRGIQFDGPEANVAPAIYTPANQRDVAIVSGTAMGLVLVRTRDDPRRIADAVRNAIRPALTVEPSQPTFSNDDFRRLTAARRFSAGLMSAFGIFALIVGAAGVYGTAAFVANQQRRGIAVRLALGAPASAVRYAILRKSLGWIAAGTILGLLTSWATSSLLASFVFGISPTEPLVYVTVSGILTAVGVAAALLPAIRAARIDPAIMLKQ